MLIVEPVEGRIYQCFHKVFPEYLLILIEYAATQAVDPFRLCTTHRGRSQTEIREP
jgi:hypothetical protein